MEGLFNIKNVFKMIATINESKTLTKNLSCVCKHKFGGRKYNSDQKWNNDKRRCECKNREEHHVCKKYYIWNPAICSSENYNFLAGIIDDLVITCDKIIEEIKTVSTVFSNKKVTYETKNVYILLTFLSITTKLLIAVSICCNHIKHQAKKKKHLFPYHIKNNK